MKNAYPILDKHLSFIEVIVALALFLYGCLPNGNFTPLPDNQKLGSATSSTSTSEIGNDAGEKNFQSAHSDVVDSVSQTDNVLKIIYFRSNKHQVVEGESAILEWATENAVRVEITGVGSVSIEGKQTVEPRKTTRYELTAWSANGENAKEAIQLLSVVPLIKPPTKPKPPRVKAPPKVELPATIKSTPRIESTSKTGQAPRTDPKPSLQPTSKPSGQSSKLETYARGLTVPIQLSPKNNSKFKSFSRKIPLRWKKVENAAYYEVEVQACHPSGCENGVKPFARFEKLTNTKCYLDDPNSWHWRWRVWALDRKGQPGPKSDWWEFFYPKK